MTNVISVTVLNSLQDCSTKMINMRMTMNSDMYSNM